MDAAARVLLDVRRVTKHFGGVRGLAGLSLSLREGELRCIIGPNGCGKTTLFNVITGAFPPTSGDVHFLGANITGLRPHQISRLGVARKFQVPGIYPSLSVAENLEVALASKSGGRRPFNLLRKGASTAILGELLQRFGWVAKAAQPAGSLAHGEKQWLEIAMLLASDARLLLLDEPTAGMTVTETEATAELVKRIQRESRVTVLVIEHDMSFVQKLECPVIVMMRGAVYSQGSYTQVQSDPAVREAYLGELPAC